jgi:phage FluMu protein Com
MSIEFGCCECGKLLRVAETFAGKKARCPACGTMQRLLHPRAAGWHLVARCSLQSRHPRSVSASRLAALQFGLLARTMQ